MELRTALRARSIVLLAAALQIFAAVFAVSTLLAPQAAAAVTSVPYLINFQGRLTDNSGNVVSDGSYNVKFRIFNAASGGTNEWEADRIYGAADHRVSVKNGLFNIQFGDTSQGDPALSGSWFNTANIANLYLEVELPTPATATCASNSCATWAEGPMTPRQPLASSPYAINSDLLDGLDSSAFGQLSAANTFTGANTFSPSSGVAVTVKPASATDALDVQNSSGVTKAFFDANGNLNLGLTLQATTSNAIDLGQSGASFRTGYFGTSLVTPALNASTAGGTLTTNAGTLQHTASGTFTVDLNDSGNTTLAVANSGAGVANLTVDGDVTVGSFAAATSTPVCSNSGTLSTCNSNPSGVNLQQAYAAGNSISTSGNDISYTLNSSQNFTVATAAGATGSTTFSLTNGANTTPPAQLVLITNNDTNDAVAAGLKITSAAGKITTAVDASGSNITNALAIGANAISGTDFNVDSSGDITAAGTALGVSSTTSGTGNSKTSMTLASATGFISGDYIQLLDTNCANASNTCYAKITAIAGNVLTITPALSWANGSTVSLYHLPEIGGTDTAQSLSTRYGRVYAIAGVATGNGTTYYDEDGITTSLSAFNLLNDPTLTTLNIGNASSTVNVPGALQVNGASVVNSSGLINGAQLQAGSVANAALTNSSIGITPGTGLSGGGTVALGASTTLNIDQTSSLTWTGAEQFNKSGGVGAQFNGAAASGGAQVLFGSVTGLQGGSASGTFLGANPTSYAGDFINFAINNTSKLKVDNSGNLAAAGQISSTSISTGNLTQSGTYFIQPTTDSTTEFQILSSTTNGSRGVLVVDTTDPVISADANLVVNSSVSLPTLTSVAYHDNTSGTLSGASGSTYFYRISAIVGGTETAASGEQWVNSSTFTPVQAQTTAPTTAVDAAHAGSLTSAQVYKYEVTYVTANGETPASNPSTGSTPGTQTREIDVTVPVGSQTGSAAITSRKIYRTLGNGSTYFFVASVSGNSSTVYTDGASDASLNQNLVPPSSSTAATNLNSITVTWPSFSGASSYNIYRGTSTHGENVYYNTAGTCVSGTCTYTDTNAASTSGTPIEPDAGRVGIGTTTPNYALDVSGNISASNAYIASGNVGQTQSCGAGNTFSGLTITGGLVTAVGICTSTGGSGGGGTATLQSAYANSTIPQIVLSSAGGALTVADTATGLGSDLFDVTDNGGTNKYLKVTATGVSTNGTFQVNGTQISTSNLSDGASVTLLGNSVNGNSELVQTTAGGALPALSGANLTALNPSNLSTGSGAVTLASGGSGALTLTSASGTIAVGSATLQRVAAGTTTIDLNDTSADTTLSITNSDATRKANLTVEGTITSTAGTINGLSVSSGTISSGTWQGTAVDVAHGGTGVGSFTAGALLYGATSSSLGQIADTTAGNCLTSNGSGNAPVWGSCGSGGGANLQLSNLGTTSISAALLSSANNTVSIGSASNVWQNVYTGNLDAGTTTTALTVGTASTTTAVTIGRSAVAVSIPGGITTSGGSINTGSGTITSTGTITGNLFSGSGASLTNLNATNIVQGTGAVTLEGASGSNVILESAGTGTVTVDTTSTSTINLGTDTANAKTIQIGPTSGTVTTTTDVGTNTSGTQTIKVGSATAGSAAAGTTVNIQGGTGSSAIVLGTNGAGAIGIDTGTTGTISIGTNANGKTINIGNTSGATNVNIEGGSGDINLGDDTGTENIDLGGVDVAGVHIVNIGTNTGDTGKITIGNAAATKAVVIDAGAAAGDLDIGNSNNAHTIRIGAGGTSTAQTVTVGSTGSTSTLNLQAAASPSSSGAGNVIVGSATTDATQINLQLDSSSNFSDAGTCSTTVNQGGLYYNTNTNTIRSCVNGNWEDVVTTSGLGLLLFGVVPDSGSGAGDLGSVTSAGVNGPCKVSWATSTTVKIVQGCTAYSGGRKVIIPDNTTPSGTLTLSNNKFVHVCLNGTNNQPAFSASGAEAADLPGFSANNPVLCLADIATSNSAITSMWDVRTFTTTSKTFATINATTGVLGAIVSQTTTANIVQLSSATTQLIRGVIVSTAGSGATNNTVNLIIATRGPQYVKATTTAQTAGVSVLETTTAGYSASGTASTTAYATLGISQLATTGTCAAAATCIDSQFTDIDIR